MTKGDKGINLKGFFEDADHTPEEIKITKGFVIDFLGLNRSWDISNMKYKTLILFANDVRAKLIELGYIRKGEYQEEFFVKEKEPTFLGLTEEQFKQLLPILNLHVRVWGEDSLIEQHSLYNIEKAYWTENENCFHVHYKSTDKHSKVWYHYELDGTWW